MRKLIAVCLITGFLFSCNGPTADSDAASSDDSGGRSEQNTPAAQTSNPADTDDTVVSAPPLEVTTAEPTASSPLPETTTSSASPEASTPEDSLIYGNDISGHYRIYLRYENYLESEDFRSVYMGVAVQDNLYDDAVADEIFQQLMDEYDLIQLSMFDDYNGDYLGPSTYTGSIEVGQAYEDHLLQHADEYAEGLAEQRNASAEKRGEIEQYFLDVQVRAYSDSYERYRIENSSYAPDMPPWFYSDREGEVLGNEPGEN